MISSRFWNTSLGPLKEFHYAKTIPVSTAFNSMCCAVNPKFFAVVVQCEGLGSFAVMPHSAKKKATSGFNLVKGHITKVVSIAWSPHNDHIIASSCEDGGIKIWDIPPNGLTDVMMASLTSFNHHFAPVHILVWHPSALNIILSADQDHKAFLWNASTGTIYVTLPDHPDLIYSAAFSCNGYQLITTCRDSIIRIFEAHTGKLQVETVGHEGAGVSRALFLSDELIFTVGFNAKSEREVALHEWKNFGTPRSELTLDQSMGELYPFFDSLTQLIFVFGRRDSFMTCFEVTTSPPMLHVIGRLQMRRRLLAICRMPKRATHGRCEQFVQISNKGRCQFMSVRPAASLQLEDDEFLMHTEAGKAAMTTEDWLAGRCAEPVNLLALKQKQELPELGEEKEWANKMEIEGPAEASTEALKNDSIKNLWEEEGKDESMSF